MNYKIVVLVSVVYGIVETLEQFGLPRKFAHILAIPLGILGSYFFSEYSLLAEHVIYGIFIGFTSVGTCDTFCNIVDIIQRKNNK